MPPRFVALLALASVLYVVASVGAAGKSVEAGVLALAVAASASALAPFWLSRLAPDGQRSWVARLGLGLAAALAAHMVSASHPLAGELLTAIALPSAGALLLLIALHVPDAPPRLRRRRTPAWLAGLLAAGSGLVGAVAALPPFPLAARSFVAPHRWSLVPLAMASGLSVAALGLRLFRARLGSNPRALAGNLWATVGISSALFGCVAAWLAARAGVRGPLLDGLIAGAASVLLLGHAFAISPARVQVASAWTRELAAGLLALTPLALLAALLARVLPGSLPWLFAPLVCSFLLVRRALRPRLTRLLAAHGGRLLSAVHEASAAAPGAGDYADFAARVLKPLRRAARLPEAAPLLWTLDPPSVTQLDGAGIARVREQAPPALVIDRLRQQLGEPLVPSELAPLLARRVELAPLVRALHELDALCVLPLVCAGELEGALLIARGARAAPVTLEELLALARLTAQLAPLAESFLALARAQRRAQAAEAARAELALVGELQAEQLHELGEQLRQVTGALGLPLPAREPVQYSAAMRELSAQLARSAALDLPILLWGETGLSFEPLARAIRREGGRASAPLVIVDGAQLAPEGAYEYLFGRSGHSGLLELMGEGTLLLTELPALPLALQRALAALLEERRGTPLASHASFAFRGRLIVTARAGLSELSEAGAVVPELARWLEQTSYRVPPLRERIEDLESLLLLALDRAARVLGKQTKGLDRAALRALLGHDWPGNDQELTRVVERALARAEGVRIGLADLPALEAASAPAQPSSFLEQEREILRRALQQAGGDRTRAARALGLKRAVFVDKLKSAGIEEPKSAHN